MTRNANLPAGYIADLSSELAELARNDGRELLALLLEMAALEADQHPKLIQTPRTETGSPERRN